MRKIISELTELDFTNIGQNSFDMQMDLTTVNATVNLRV